MVDRSNPRFDSESVTENVKSLREEDESVVGTNARSPLQATGLAGPPNECNYVESCSIGNCSWTTQTSGKSFTSGGEATVDDASHTINHAGGSHISSKPNSQIYTQDMSIAERQQWFPGTPVTQTYDFAASDVNTSDFLDPRGDGEYAQLLENTLIDLSLTDLSKYIHEDLAGLEIKDLTEYLEVESVTAPESFDRVCDDLPSARHEVIVHYLWFSAPSNLREQSQAIESVQHDDVESMADVERIINTWQLICLVRHKILNVTFAENLYHCRFENSIESAPTLMDLTEEARRHWFDSFMLEKTISEVSEKLLSSLEPTKTLINRKSAGVLIASCSSQEEREKSGVVLLQDDGVEGAQDDALDAEKPELLQCQTDDRVHELKSAIDKKHRCMVYGCRERFENTSMLLSHLAIGNHAFMCPVLECGPYVFESQQVYQNHIFIQHPEQNWKLYRPPPIQAELNSEFDDRQVAGVWKCGTAPRRRKRHTLRTWD